MAGAVDQRRAPGAPSTAEGRVPLRGACLLASRPCRPSPSRLFAHWPGISRCRGVLSLRAPSPWGACTAGKPWPSLRRPPPSGAAGTFLGLRAAARARTAAPDGWMPWDAHAQAAPAVPAETAGDAATSRKGAGPPDAFLRRSAIAAVAGTVSGGATAIGSAGGQAHGGVLHGSGCTASAARSDIGMSQGHRLRRTVRPHRGRSRRSGESRARGERWLDSSRVRRSAPAKRRAGHARRMWSGRSGAPIPSEVIAAMTTTRPPQPALAL